jgi:hypothetical protein
MGDVVVTSGPVRVSSVTGELGGPGAGALLKYSGTAKAVTADLTAAQKELGKPGTKVSMTLNGKTFAGTVASIAPAPPDSSNNGQNQEQKFTATITPDDQAAVGEQDAGSVDVRFVTGSRQGVLAVPVGALVALAEGGYAVEVVEGTNRRLVAVHAGLFADGKVEVSGPDLREGMRVVTTS